MKLNPYRHYFLYAKNHYKRDNVFEDLKKIQCDYVGCDLGASITKADIIRVTSRAIQPILMKRYADPVEKYQEFLFEYGKVYVGHLQYEECSLPDAMILANLGIMMSSTIDEIDGSLGKADLNLLPKGGL